MYYNYFVGWFETMDSTSRQESVIYSQVETKDKVTQVRLWGLTDSM